MNVIQSVGTLFLFLLFFLVGTQPKAVISDPIAQKIKTTHLASFMHFQQAVDTLVTISIDATTDDIPRLQNQLLETRLAYKRIEFLFDHFHTKYTYLNINGGPLYKMNEDDNESPLIAPNGLQALDELLFSQTIADNLQEVQTLAKQLKKAVNFIQTSHINHPFEPYIILEAMRSGLIRVFALGVSGFDTPGSLNALQEAATSLTAMQHIFQLFETKLPPESKTVFVKTNQLFALGIEQLTATNSFNDFDRMTFLKTVINPLYKQLRLFTQLQNNPTRYKIHAHNYESDNLFDAHFLDQKYFQAYSYLPLNRPKSIALGKRLFYDTSLSKDDKMSCASCHQPNKAFTDGLALSKTNQINKFTKRNTPTLINATFSHRFFYDLRTFNLERQVAHVVNDTLEFNTNFKAIVKNLNQDTSYVALFSEAYAEVGAKRTISKRSISNALAAYVNTLVALNSPFDKYVRNETTNYSADAIRGFNLFMGKAACATCHFVPTFGGVVPPYYLESESEVLGITIGLDTIHPRLDLDLGRYANGRKWDARPPFKNAFKTVSIRNVALTAPYMHNGTFNSLEEVLHFYNHGGGAGMGSVVDNQTLSASPLQLNQQEIADIIAFMESLTDTTGLDKGVLLNFGRQ